MTGTPWIRLAGPLAIGQRGPVRPPADLAAGAVGVVVADLAVGRVVVEHRVHVAGADGEAQPRPAERPPRLAGMPVGLAEDGHAIALGLQQPAQQGHGEAGMIDVGVAGDEDHVDGVPAAGRHFLAGHRQRLPRALLARSAEGGQVRRPHSRPLLPKGSRPKNRPVPDGVWLSCHGGVGNTTGRDANASAERPDVECPWNRSRCGQWLTRADRLAEPLACKSSSGEGLPCFVLAAVEQHDPIDAAGQVLDIGVNAGHAAVLAEAEAVAAGQHHVPSESEMRAVLPRLQRRRRRRKHLPIQRRRQNALPRLPSRAVRKRAMSTAEPIQLPRRRPDRIPPAGKFLQAVAAVTAGLVGTRNAGQAAPVPCRSIPAGGKHVLPHVLLVRLAGRPLNHFAAKEEAEIRVVLFRARGRRPAAG